MSFFSRFNQSRGHRLPVRQARSSPLISRARPRLFCEELEGRTLLASTITAAFAAGPGGGPEVTVRFDDGQLFSFFALDPSTRGGVSAILGRVNGNEVPDVIVGAGAGGGPRVQVFDGLALLQGEVVVSANFFAFDPRFSDGVSLAAGQINGTGYADVVVANGPGGPPEVSIFDGAELARGNAVSTASFSAFDPRFLGGVSLAVGPVNGTRHADLVIGAGPGGGPEVRVIDGASLAKGQVIATASFFAFPTAFAGGVELALGPVNGTAHDDIVVAAGPGGGPEVAVFDGAQAAFGQVVETAAFFAFDPSFRGGVSLALGDINQTGHADVVVGAGPGGTPEVKVFDGARLAQGEAVATADFLALPSQFQGGVQVYISHEPGFSPDTLIVVAGPGGGPEAVIYDTANFAVDDFAPLDAFFAFDPNFRGGIDLGYQYPSALTFIAPGQPVDLLAQPLDEWSPPDEVIDPAASYGYPAGDYFTYGDFGDPVFATDPFGTF